MAPLSLSVPVPRQITIHVLRCSACNGRPFNALPASGAAECPKCHEKYVHDGTEWHNAKMAHLVAKPPESSCMKTPADEPDILEIERLDIAEKPYEVYHSWAEGRPPTFKTWAEARTAAREWNKECPGHIARKRRPSG